VIKTILKYLFRLIWIPTELLFAFIFVLFTIVLFNAQIDTPEVPEIHVGERKKVGKDHYVLGNSYLKKNDFGIWEMYLEGAPYERGLIYGILAKELMEKQGINVSRINSLFTYSAIFNQDAFQIRVVICLFSGTGLCCIPVIPVLRKTDEPRRRV
jgi:hypothetical protein